MNTVIRDEQDSLLTLIKGFLGNIVKIDAESLAFVNRPPATIKPPYMKIWEARKIDGLDYDEDDPAQQMYLANISSPKTITVA
jgi:hypothetical protein